MLFVKCKDVNNGVNMANISEVFNEDEKIKEIVVLKKKIEQESNKDDPDGVQIARLQRQIVLLRQEIFANYMKR